jgi:hypothetical protein
VLNRALDLPDVDWLIRSETSPDEAFDIEVTGGWVTLKFLSSCGSVAHPWESRSAVPPSRYLILPVSACRTIIPQSHPRKRLLTYPRKRRQALHRSLAPLRLWALPVMNLPIHRRIHPLLMSRLTFPSRNHNAVSRDVSHLPRTGTPWPLTCLLPLKQPLYRLRWTLQDILLVLLTNPLHHRWKVSQLLQASRFLLRRPVPSRWTVHPLMMR